MENLRFPVSRVILTHLHEIYSFDNANGGGTDGSTDMLVNNPRSYLAPRADQLSLIEWIALISSILTIVISLIFLKKYFKL